MRVIEVYCMGRYAGLLEESDHRHYIFRYSDEYLEDTALPPVSVNLPKHQQEYEGEALLPYFQSLLPEGRNRKVFCQENKVDEDDWFGMLAALSGRDIPGAVKLKSDSQ
ncbi:MAG: HipA N-terminal domain-containing protein [Bacteroidales bacterium]|nr:HipA N-terminal domain-containing protein [Bacteroidales bacterium]